MKIRFRLLPVTIFAAVLLLSLKTGEFWRGMDALPDSVTVAETRAQTNEEDAADADAAAGPTESTESTESTEPTEPAEPTEPTAEGQAEGISESEIEAMEAALEEEVSEFSEAEIQTLQDLASRREILDLREREVDMRGGLLDAAERRVEAKISELKKLQTMIEGLLRKYDAQEEQNLKSLVKIYENMKPKDAARIFEQLDMNILLSVVEGMSERKVAPVLAKMAPEKAKAVTSELALRRHMPRGDSELGALQGETAPDTGG